MTDAEFIIGKTRKYVAGQRRIDLLAWIILVFGLTLISLTTALFFFKSPFYGLIGVVPLLFYRPLRLIPGARRLEEKIGLADELVNSIQFSSITDDCREGYSRGLIDAYTAEVWRQIQEIDFKKFLDHRNLSRAVQILALSVVLALIPPALFPQRFFCSLTHRIDYLVQPGSRSLPKDREAEFAVHLNGVYIPKDAAVVIRDGAKVARTRIAVVNNVGRYTMKVTGPIQYHFEFLNQRTEDFLVQTIEPIYLEYLCFYLKYPAYTKLAPDTQPGRQLIAVTGTKVNLSGRASVALHHAYLEYDGRVELACSEKEFSGSFVIKKSETAVLCLNALNELKEEIRIYAVPDLPPLVDIFVPGHDITLPHDMQVGIGIKCSDDYGLDKGNFYYMFKDSAQRPLEVRHGTAEDTIHFVWDLSDLGLLPGDEVSYFAEVSDLVGHKTRSRVYRINFPTIEEMYRAVNEQEDMLQENFRKLQSEHASKTEELKRIEHQFLKERKISWPEVERLRELIKKEEGFLEKLDGWRVEVEKTIEELNQGIILDPQVIRRLQEIGDLLQEIAPEQMRQALAYLEKELDQPENLKKALERLQDTQEDLAQALERTLEIMERFRQEEKLIELAELARALAREQEELKAAGEGQEGDAQERIDAGIEDLAEQLKELAGSKELETAIKDALENLTQKTRELARPSTTAALKKTGLDLLAQDLEMLYEKLTQGRAENLREKLLRILEQLIQVSKDEEGISTREPRASREFQNDLIPVVRTVADSLYNLQNRSFYVTPWMGKNLAAAIKFMDEASRQFEDKNRTPKAAGQAMALINIVCLEMLKRFKEITGGGSSTGMDKFLENLANISKGQMSLNQSLSNLFPIPAAGLTPEQISRINNLAQRQNELRQALESLRAGADPDQQRLLDNVIDEMKQAEEDLFQYKIDRQLIERQQRIISRLLDAQHSIRLEDYGEKRQSEPGKDILDRELPRPIVGEMGRDQLRELIQRALREPYPKEYEPYIREYFQKLLEQP